MTICLCGIIHIIYLFVDLSLYYIGFEYHFVIKHHYVMCKRQYITIIKYFITNMTYTRALKSITVAPRKGCSMMMNFCY